MLCELFCFGDAEKAKLEKVNGISLSGQTPLSVKSLFSWWCFSSSRLLLTRCTERDRAGMVKAQWGTAEVGWPLTLALTLFLLDGGHWGSRGCLLISTMQPFPQAMVGRKTPWSSSHHLKAFQHGPAGQGQVPERWGQGRKQERGEKLWKKKYNNDRKWRETIGFRVYLNLPQQCQHLWFPLCSAQRI